MRPTTIQGAIDAFCSHLERHTNLTRRTIADYRNDLGVITRNLHRLGIVAMPWELTEEDIITLMGDWTARHLSVATRRGYIGALRVWTRFYRSDVIDRMHIRLPHDDRPRVDWITEEQARDLLMMEMTPPQEIVVHCELCLGMRRVEILRLTPDSFRGTHVEILGKGPQGGKPRIMPYHRDTGRVLQRYLGYRAGLVQLAMQYPDALIPEALLVYFRGKTLRTYADKGTGIDGLLAPLSASLGVHFSNHTLRRTFGRTMYRSGVEPATIARMMGHESTVTTLRYIGVDLDDMQTAMEAFRI